MPGKRKNDNPTPKVAKARQRKRQWYHSKVEADPSYREIHAQREREARQTRDVVASFRLPAAAPNESQALLNFTSQAVSKTTDKAAEIVSHVTSSFDKKYQGPEPSAESLTGNGRLLANLKTDDSSSSSSSSKSEGEISKDESILHCQRFPSSNQTTPNRGYEIEASFDSVYLGKDDRHDDDDDDDDTRDEYSLGVTHGYEEGLRDNEHSLDKNGARTMFDDDSMPPPLPHDSDDLRDDDESGRFDDADESYADDAADDIEAVNQPVPHGDERQEGNENEYGRDCRQGNDSFSFYPDEKASFLFPVGNAEPRDVLDCHFGTKFLEDKLGKLGVRGTFGEKIEDLMEKFQLRYEGDLYEALKYILNARNPLVHHRTVNSFTAAGTDRQEFLYLVKKCGLALDQMIVEAEIEARHCRKRMRSLGGNGSSNRREKNRRRST